LRRRRKAYCQETGEDRNKRNGKKQAAAPKWSNKTTAIASHRTLSPLLAATESNDVYDDNDNARVESAAKPFTAADPISG
jgi:hypothetical protein